MIGVAGALTALAVAAPAAMAADEHGHSDCSLDPSAGGSELNEFGSCLQVSAKLSKAPSLGQEAVLSIKVRAQESRPGTEVSIDLPDGLSFSDPPNRFSIRGARTGAGPVDRASVTTRVAPGDPATYELEVEAVETGFAPIHVTAEADAPGGLTERGYDDVFAKVGRTDSGSTLDPVVDAGGGTTSVTGIDVEPAPKGGAVPPLKAGSFRGRPHARATSCATGRFVYRDAAGVWQGASNVSVQIWDQDGTRGGSDDDLLTSGFGNNGGSNDGGFNLCFDGADGAGGGQEVYARILLDNSRWRVRDTPGSNATYVWETGSKAIGDPGTAVFGTFAPADTAEYRALAINDSVNHFYNFLPLSANSCWDANDTTCKKVTVNWTKTSTDGTYYCPNNVTYSCQSGDDVHLAAVDADFPDLILHEVGHFLMDDVYEDSFPSAPNCSPHFINSAHSTGCAWTEGFAYWIALEANGSPVLDQPTFSQNYETLTWNTSNWADGDAVESRVTGAMLDIVDSANEQYWDRRTEGFTKSQRGGPLYSTFLDRSSPNFFDYLVTDRAAEGWETALTGSTRAAAFQNTIDYSYRDPLANGVDLLRPTLGLQPTRQNFFVQTTGSRWLGAAIRFENVVADYALDLYSTSALSGLVETSDLIDAPIEYTLIDGNHVGIGNDFYPQARRVTGGSAFRVELADQTLPLTDGLTQVSMQSNDVIRIFNTGLAAGVRTHFRVVPTSSSQDPGLLLHDSDPASSTTLYQDPSEAVVSGTTRGPGVAEEFSYMTPTADAAGLVLINEFGGSGTYKVYRDTTRPTGSVSINNGASLTRSRTVTLNIPASDAQTGISYVRISTDGTLDTEVWQLYSPTKTVVLPVGDGTKNVRVQFANNAGMPSGVYFDTITMNTRPDLVVSALTNPPSSRFRGGSFSLASTVKNLAGNSAGKSATKFYLSGDSKLGSADVLLSGAQAVPILAAAASSTSTVTLGIPSSTAPGSYVVIACADSTKVVIEFSEANNCRATTSAIKVT